MQRSGEGLQSGSPSHPPLWQERLLWFWEPLLSALMLFWYNLAQASNLHFELQKQSQEQLDLEYQQSLQSLASSHGLATISLCCMYIFCNNICMMQGDPDSTKLKKYTTAAWDSGSLSLSISLSLLLVPS